MKQLRHRHCTCVELAIHGRSMQLVTKQRKNNLTEPYVQDLRNSSLYMFRADGYASRSSGVHSSYNLCQVKSSTQHSFVSFCSPCSVNLLQISTSHNFCSPCPVHIFESLSFTRLLRFMCITCTSHAQLYTASAVHAQYMYLNPQLLTATPGYKQYLNRICT